MPDRRRHRGPHPQDASLFAPGTHEVLRRASKDLAWLLGRDYALVSSLKLVGDRYALKERQRTAVMRATCADRVRAARRGREVGPRAAAGRRLLVDGYNVLITVEAALAGGVLLLGRDGCLRDLASLHGSFKRVEETQRALEVLGAALAAWRLGPVTIYLDAPVSNSGRLAARMRALAAERNWPWTVTIIPSPDAALARARSLVATSDSAVLDRCGAWFNLARRTVARFVPEAAWIAFR